MSGILQQQLTHSCYMMYEKILDKNMTKMVIPFSVERIPIHSASKT